MQIVYLNDDEMNVIRNFCYKITEKENQRGSRDRRRNDTGPDRALHGLTGKIGEYAATRVYGGVVDFTVWETGTRGLDQFEPDIIDDPTSPIIQEMAGKRLHVKTCSAKYLAPDTTTIRPARTASWTIDRQDPLVTSPSDDDVFVLAFASTLSRAYVYGHVPATAVKPFWKPCIALRHKVAIYYPDIRHLITEA